MDRGYPDIETTYQAYSQAPGEASLTQLIQACQGLVFHYAKLYGGGYCFEDLCQSGYEGLLKAIPNFDEKKGVKFVTYASHYIIGGIRHYVRRERRYYSPGFLTNYHSKMDDMVLSGLERGEEPLSEEELADGLNLKPESVLPVMGAGLVHLGHLEIASIKAKELESFTLPVEDKLLLSQLKYRLTDVQKDVIEMLFHEGMTQEEVAKELGISQRQVSRIKEKGLQRMKQGNK